MRSPVYALLAVVLFLAGCKEQVLFSNLQQRDAFEIVAALRQSGFSPSMAAGSEAQTYNISIGSGDSTAAIEVLTRLGLPRKAEASPLEVLGKDNWMVSKSQEDMKLSYTLGRDIARTITEINGVRDANVHVALAQKNSIGQPITEPSASVLVRFDPAVAGQELEAEVANLVANAVPGLNYDRVAVTLVPNLAAGAAGQAADPVTAATGAAGDIRPAGWGVSTIVSVGLAMLALAFLWTVAGRSRRTR